MVLDLLLIWVYGVLVLSVPSQARSKMKFHKNQFTTVSKLDDGGGYSIILKTHN